MDESRIDDIPQVSLEENALLIKNSEEEVRKAVFQTEHNTAPDPDAFHTKFYQIF
jgi:hypothetical protein